MELPRIHNQYKTPQAPSVVIEGNFASTKRVRESGGKYSTSRKQGGLGANTPSQIIELVIQVLGAIDLDPCADDGKRITARQHYTAADDGLQLHWNGHLFINPPQECPELWVRKLREEIQSGRVTEAIALVAAATDTDWLSELLATQPVCFWRGRIQFLDDDYLPAAPVQQSYVLVYWGNNQDRFEQVFKGYGTVHLPAPKKVLVDELEISREKVLVDEAPFSLEKNLEPLEALETLHIVVSSSSGSLYRYLKNNKLKSGIVASYPRVEGARDPDNLNHWYWGYNYKILVGGSWKSKSVSVSRQKVHAVRQMIESSTSVATIKDFIRVLAENPEISRERVLEEKAPFSLEKKSASGRLYSYTKDKTLKSGVIASYPRVTGERDPNNLEHWYWGYSYEVLENGEWRGRSLSVPRNKVAPVQAMIDSHKTINEIKSFIEGK
jgi:DNA N-6-adenine-methyltransferase (Dam)